MYLTQLIKINKRVQTAADMRRGTEHTPRTRLTTTMSEENKKEQNKNAKNEKEKVKLMLPFSSE